ncbi:TPA: DUF551 domain-containing protein [Yersinia enterocolitica]|uniref:DUF551 domain-containing protein n=1 Tax=Yersinia enterocolitica TaxID=630 RepID=UPI0005FCF7DC|nr:DUF551 domain-containing protein [Yersinia enterocolitica]EKN5933365.1 DUF551 domain-containing protein [Yersinia enterocolitica]CRE89812.1 Protein of uncharacterised function (DUF551) [Yersinia enterocolitica]HDL7350193.1 DUF551 domain-containing protein [Yersinia enterocolitica]
MNKELNSFTVERLEELANSPNGENKVFISEAAALARIALAAKRAEPEWYVVITSVGVWQSRYKTRSEAESHIKPWHKDYWIKELYTTPQLNSQVPLGSWINCSDRMPEDDEFVRIWPLPDFGVELHVGQYIKFHKEGPGWFAQVYEYNYGVEFYPITVTHWMPLPAAPESE